MPTCKQCDTEVAVTDGVCTTETGRLCEECQTTVENASPPEQIPWQPD